PWGRGAGGAGAAREVTAPVLQAPAGRGDVADAGRERAEVLVDPADQLLAGGALSLGDRIVPADLPRDRDDRGRVRLHGEGGRVVAGAHDDGLDLRDLAALRLEADPDGEIHAALRDHRLSGDAALRGVQSALGVLGVP